VWTLSGFFRVAPAWADPAFRGRCPRLRYQRPFRALFSIHRLHQGVSLNTTPQPVSPHVLKDSPPAAAVP
jgi:hypothetical protein